ncbi:hypothetical protein, partial [Kaarinaea lacus]
ILYEKMALKEFEFNGQLYQWARQTIRRTQARMIQENISKAKRASNFEEYVLMHNLRMLEKHADELRFAENYKISSALSKNNIPLI